MKFKWYNNGVSNIKVYEGQSTDDLKEGYILSSHQVNKKRKLVMIDKRYEKKKEKLRKAFEAKHKKLEDEFSEALELLEKERIKKGHELFHVL